MNLFLGLLFFTFLPFPEGTARHSIKDSESRPTAENLDRHISEGQNLIYWNKEHPLDWTFFKGKVDPADKVHGAVTYAGLDLQTEKYNPWNGEITFKVTAVFDQNLSWVKPECREERLLAHEQLHFDIAELFARRLESKLKSLKPRKKDVKMIKRLQMQYNEKQLEMQKRYDRETIHGLRAGQQKSWRRAIDRQLQHPE